MLCLGCLVGGSMSTGPRGRRGCGTYYGASGTIPLDGGWGGSFAGGRMIIG